MVSKQVSLTSELMEFTDIDEFTDLAFERGWTDGFPVVPATPRRVGQMLEYIKRSPDEVLGVMEPAQGVASIESIVINCAMAGCKPEYVPVVLAAVEAMLDHSPSGGLQVGAQNSTHGPGPLALISGPVVKKLGFNYAEGALSGSGHRVNGTIARAIRLVVWNVGQSRPGQLSAAVFGQSSRWGCLLAERPRDDGNPWNDYHVDYAGLQPEDSAVTIGGGAGRQLTTGFAASTIEKNIYTIAKSISGTQNEGAAGLTPSGHLVVLNPTGAKMLAEAGWTKEKVRDAIYAQTTTTVRDLKKWATQRSPSHKYYWKKRVNPDDDDAILNIMVDPSQLKITVSGGWGGSNCCYHFSGDGVTKRINWKWD